MILQYPYHITRTGICKHGNPPRSLLAEHGLRAGNADRKKPLPYGRGGGNQYDKVSNNEPKRPIINRVRTYQSSKLSLYFMAYPPFINILYAKASLCQERSVTQTANEVSIVMKEQHTKKPLPYGRGGNCSFYIYAATIDTVINMRAHRSTIMAHAPNTSRAKIVDARSEGRSAFVLSLF